MDDLIRRLEREIAAGSYEARGLWKTALLRAGLPDPDRLDSPLSYEEEIQADYDDIWWHARRRLCFGWDFEPHGGLVKAHHSWGHRRGWHGENSKRKTLRTHREGSSRRVKRPKDAVVKEPRAASSAVATRRKKRFGGRVHKKYWHRGQWGPWLFEPDLDE